MSKYHMKYTINLQDLNNNQQHIRQLAMNKKSIQ